MLSKMTELTVPTSESHRNSDGSFMDATRAAAKIVQGLEAGLSAANASKAAHQLGRDQHPPRLRVGTRTTTSPKTPRTPRSPPPSQTPLSPGNESASEFIDDWFTALHGPTRQLPRPGPYGTVRRGNVLLPPNLRRPVPMTPTRRSAKNDVFIPPSATPIRFLANDPDDWKTPDEWNLEVSTKTHPAGDGVPEQDEEVGMNSTTTALGSLHIDKQDVKDDEDTQEDDQLLESPTKKPGAAPSVCCQFQWKVAPGARGRLGATRTT